MSWLRLQTCTDCIPHPCHMHTHCFSTSICCGWAYGFTLTLLRLCRAEAGVDFRKIELSPNPSDVIMSWLRLQTHTEWFPHPCHMYTQCFSTLICCEWAYGCTLTLLRLCRSGVEFRKIELSPSPSDVVPDLDKTWDAQNYVLRELKSGRSPNQPCNSEGLGDGVILRKTEQFPSRFSFV